METPGPDRQPTADEATKKQPRKRQPKTEEKKKATSTKVAAKKRKKTGRPRLKLDKEQIKRLAEIGCTFAEVAAVMGCAVNTIRSRFCTIIKNGMEIGNASLKRTQFRRAMGGNIPMLIWLGKQRLGQRDTLPPTFDSDHKPLPWQD